MPIAFKNLGLAVRLACNHPCSFDKFQDVLKQSCILGLLGGEQLNPQDGGGASQKQAAFPLGGAKGMYEVHCVCVSVCICIKAANTTFDPFDMRVTLLNLKRLLRCI